MPLRELLKVTLWAITFRLPSRLRQRADAETIAESDLFDLDFYLEENADVAEANVDAVSHYVREGAAEGRNPSPFFDSAYYLEKNSDVRKGRRNPLAHYIRSGAAEMRNPHPRFDTNYYFETNPHLAKAGVDALLHYISIGVHRGLRPHADFPSVAPFVGLRSASTTAGHPRSAHVPNDDAFDDVHTNEKQGIAFMRRRGSAVEGRVDRYSQSSVSGWARDPRDPLREVVVDMQVGSEVWKTVVANSHRLDLDRKYGDGGRHGFIWEFPPLMFEEQGGRVAAVPRGGANKIVAREGVVEPFVRAKRLEGSLATDGKRALAANLIPDRPSPGANGKTASQWVEVIVLNLNGAPLLEKFFSAFEEFNTHSAFTITIVDHGSTDDSEAVTKKWAKTLAVDWLPRHRNFTFSESNNFAAESSDADVLIFANNDIYLDSDVLPSLLEMLLDESLALVGIKLLDIPIGGCDDVDKDDPRWVQHLGVHFDRFRRDRFADDRQLVAPFETRATPLSQPLLSELVSTPAVTGAFMATRRTEFLEAGGFHEGYFYGYEDVDLCLKAVLELGKRVACANQLTAYHDRGYSRRQMDPESALRIAANRHLLDQRFGYAYRRRTRSDLFERPGFWNVSVPRIAFAVSEAHENATAGDYFTALELAREMEAQFACQCLFLERKTSWYDLSGIDVVIAMVDQYDLSKIENASDSLVKVAWIRNWFDRFADCESASSYDLVWASSAKAAEYLSKRLAKDVSVLPLATNLDAFKGGSPQSDLESDYCFTGHYWNAERDIATHLKHDEIPFDGKIFGNGWEKVAALRGIAQGPLAYERMPDVYASTKIVLDDANHVTKPWGSVNSRVFDAIAAGRLVVTNGLMGNEDLFDGKLPSYESTDELTSVLGQYINDPTARNQLQLELLRIVEERHTYGHRAAEAWRFVSRAAKDQLRIAIKIGTPTSAVRAEWGDYHFAAAMKRSLDRQGHTTRIDCIDRWNCPETFGDDIVIVLRGLSKYEPRPDHINLIWIISHPDRVTHDELEGFDHVFVASQSYAEKLHAKLDVPTSLLLQCTDPEVFAPPSAEPDELGESLGSEGIVLVGNSRKKYRRIIRDCVTASIDFRVVGTNWEGIIEEKRILARHISNEELGDFYSRCEIVLNDHWDSMREHGFLSNRLFDAAACGAQILTDHVEGLEEVFGDVVLVYHDSDDLLRLTETAKNTLESGRSKRLALSKHVRAEHSFDARMRTLLEVVDVLDRRRREGANVAGKAAGPEGGRGVAAK